MQIDCNTNYYNAFNQDYPPTTPSLASLESRVSELAKNNLRSSKRQIFHAWSDEERALFWESFHEIPVSSLPLNMNLGQLPHGLMKKIFIIYTNKAGRQTEDLCPKRAYVAFSRHFQKPLLKHLNKRLPDSTHATRSTSWSREEENLFFWAINQIPYINIYLGKNLSKLPPALMNDIFNIYTQASGICSKGHSKRTFSAFQKNFHVVLLSYLNKSGETRPGPTPSAPSTVSDQQEWTEEEKLLLTELLC